MRQKRPLRILVKGARRGTTVLEASLAIVVLMGAAVLLAQLLVATSQQRKANDERRLALEELSNRMERILSAKWQDVDAAAIEKEPLARESAEKLPGAKLTASVADEPGPAGGKRVRLAISWENRAGQRVTPIGITAWKHRRQEVLP